MLNVLIICEESQTSCIAFLKRGHNAYSCDIQPCSGGLPGRHFMLDCFDLLSSKAAYTQDGNLVVLPKWDLVIAHPPCTYLSMASAKVNPSTLFTSVFSKPPLESSPKIFRIPPARFTSWI